MKTLYVKAQQKCRKRMNTGSTKAGHSVPLQFSPSHNLHVTSVAVPFSVVCALCGGRAIETLNGF